MTYTRVVVVMIVRDEEAIIDERLAAIRDEIDGYCIVDTGSTDDTVDAVRAALLGRPGRISSMPWVGFGRCRTEALARATILAEELWPKDQTYALLLDADTVVDLRPGWRHALRGGSVDVVEATVEHGTLRYDHPRLLRLGALPWRFRGVVHEYLEVPGGVRRVHSDLVRIVHGSGGARSRDPEKYRRDAEILSLAREEATEPDLDSRYTFYEAQSWRDSGDHQRAIDLYVERAGQGGWLQEVYVSWLRVGELRWWKQSRAEALLAFFRAYAVDPSRAEAPIGIATMMREESLWAPAMVWSEIATSITANSEPHGLFAESTVRWRALFEVSVAAWYVGQRNRGAAAAEAVLAEPEVPEAVRDRTRANLALYRV